MDFLERIRDGCAVFDSDWRTLFTNSRFAEICGKRRDELAGARLQESCPDLTSGRFWEAAQQCLEEGEARFLQFYEARQVWLEGQFHRKPGAVQLIVHERDEELRRILDNVPVIVSYVDEHLRFYRLNRVYDEVFGRSAEDAIGKHLSEVAGEPHFSIASPYIERALKGERVSFESRIRHRDGRLRDIAVTYTPQRKADGTSGGFIAMVQDTTEHSRAQRELDQERRRAAGILESITDAFFALDNEWRFTYVNKEAEPILRRPVGDLLGKHFWEEFPNLKETPFFHHLHRARRENEAAHFEQFHEHIEVWAEVRVFPSADGLAVYFRDISERKKAEQEKEQLLRELDMERGRLEAIFESIPAGIVFAEAPSGRVVLTNHYVEEILGHPLPRNGESDPYRSELAYHPDGRQVMPDEWPLMRTLRGEVVRGMEILHERTPGVFRWMRVDGAPVRDSAGKVLGGAAAFFDTHDEYNAAQVLERRERELSMVLENIPDAILRLGPDFRITLASAALERQTGRSADWFLGKNVQNIGLPPETARALDASLREVWETGLSKRVDFDYEGSNGMRHCSSVIAPEFGPDGAVVSLLTITRDITDRKKAAEALREGEHRLRIALETARLGAFDLDLATGHFECSEKFKSNLGLPPDAQLNYEALQNCIHPEDLPGMRRAVNAAVESGRDYRAEYRCIWPDGSTHWIVANGRVLCDRSGQPACVTGVTLDVTESKQAEEALTRQAQELARSNADLQQFAYVTSHDLQEPLRTITSFAQMISHRYSGQLDADAEEFLAYIVAGAKRMKALIDALLAFSRVVHAEMTPFSRVNLDGAVHWALMNLRAVIEESGASVECADLPSVEADHVQLVQLFQNLISNAIKYAKPGRPPEVRISAVRKGGDWVIEVRDNGIGIEPQHAQRIFGVFKRLHGKDVPGTGIGLAICKRIVEKHGGHIWVESQPDQGSRFFFSLPA